ncbi:MAG TPA: hypothetical protein VGI82_01455 [Chitinophagaceae bacterium]
MNYSYDFPKSKFYQSIMTAFFVGFFATVVCLIYNVIFRTKTVFPLSDFINVSSLIFLINLLFPIIGIIHYGFVAAFKKAEIVFVIVFLALTAFLVWRIASMHRTENNQLVNMEFRQLLLPIVLILGISAGVFVPLLYRNRKFRDSVL